MHMFEKYHKDIIDEFIIILYNKKNVYVNEFI